MPPLAHRCIYRLSVVYFRAVLLLLQPGPIYTDMAIVPCPWFVFYEQKALLWLLEEHESQCSGCT